jgi:hypothetical protein
VTLIANLDESGDRSLANTAHDSPVFALGFLVCEVDRYVKEIVPPITQLKFEFFGHDAVILHLREIHHRMGPFAALQNKERCMKFWATVQDIIKTAPFELIAVAIRKPEHIAKYGTKARDPYELSLEFGLERLSRDLHAVGQKEITLVAESRNKKDNDRLRGAFDHLIKYGSFYQTFDHGKFELDFAPKSANAVGHQLADLCIGPVARFAATGESTKAFEIVKAKMSGKRGYGLKIFP